jgi:hypothetical protein
MYFGKVTRAIRKPDLGDSFELSPPNTAVALAKPHSHSHRAAKGNGLDVAYLADDREPHGA